MLKILESIKSMTRPKEGVVGIGCNSRAGRDGNKLDGIRSDDNEFDNKGNNELGKKGQNLSKSKKMKSSFFISGARMAFTKLRQMFIKAPILHHFNLERHIRVEIDASDYAGSRVLSQLTLDNLGRWHLVAFILQKMIPAETRYETHNNKLLAIVEAFKT